MKAITLTLFAAGFGAGTLLAAPTWAADSSAWLQRQFSTVHGAYAERAARPASATAADDVASLEVAADWIERNVASQPPFEREAGVAGPAGPTGEDDSSLRNAEIWLERQLGTDHRAVAR